MAARHDFFATTAKGLEELLAAELRDLRAECVTATRAGVSFAGPLEVAYRACLWSRVANRILLPLATFRAATPEELYAGVRAIRWVDHVNPRGTLAVTGTTSQSRLTHSHFIALKTKDAIVDHLRERSSVRPSIDVDSPDVRVNVYVHRDRAVVGIDLSGESLHRRAYRQHAGAAPLKENLAAAILLLAEWPRLARAGAPFIDPMCGSGTLPLEAASIAADIAPGLRRQRFGFARWLGHHANLWHRLVKEAEEREIRDPRRLPVIHGYDVDARAVRGALANVELAGLRGRVHIERRALADCQPPPNRHAGGGLFVVNPPYGERLGEVERLAPLYEEIGDVLRRRFTGWTGYVLAGSPALAKRIGLRPTQRITLYNGAIECRLLKLPISATKVQSAAGPGWRKHRADA
ncbi:MAG TPA: THUMP domain-containing protein [Candidatus Binatia bacterium]|nr:THUMP domain-containing protein [Candidatus Binatia bacterium]